VRSATWVLHSRKSTLSHCPRISIIRYRGFNLCPPGVEACGPAVAAHKCVNPFTQKLINPLKHQDGAAASVMNTCAAVPDWSKVPQKFSFNTNWAGAKAFCEKKGMRLPCVKELCTGPDKLAPGVPACDGAGGLGAGGSTTDKWSPVMDKVKGGYGEYFGCSRDLIQHANGADQRGCELHSAHAGGNIPSWGGATGQRWQGWVYCVSKDVKQPC